MNQSCFRHIIKENNIELHKKFKLSDTQGIF
jgi:hypothetical protein